MKPKTRTTGQAVNWDEVRRRMDRAAEATEGALRLSPERSRAVLEERARLLARAPAAAAQASEVLEIAAFTLANEDYGVETRYVREVVRLTEYAPVPGAPSFLAGMMNLRGEILALVDLRTFFGLPATGLTDLARVLILGNEYAEFGVLADAALEITALRVEELHEPPEAAAGVDRKYLRGVTKDALIVLDGAALLRDGRLFVDQGDEAGA